MTPQRILVIRPDRVGDVVLTTPLIRAVKNSYPRSFVGVLVSSATAPLLQNNPHVDILITDDPEGKDAGRAGFWRLAKLVRAQKFDTGLMPLPRERHAWMMLLAGIRTRVGVGGKLFQILTGTQTVTRNNYIPLRHEADYVMDLGRKIGVTDNDLAPELFPRDEEKRSAVERLVSKGIDPTAAIIGINPSSGGSVPNWTPQRYLELIQSLSRRYQIVINVSRKDREIEDMLGPMLKPGIVIERGDLRELMALCTTMRLLVSSSTGTMHIAAALGIPTVSLFCPLTACSPLLWGPLGNRAEVILPGPDYCQLRCPKDPKVCPLDDIEVASVVRRVEAILQERRHN
jgi:heptosyltransferase-2